MVGSLTSTAEAHRPALNGDLDLVSSNGTVASLAPVGFCLPVRLKLVFLSSSISLNVINRFSGVQKRLRFPKLYNNKGTGPSWLRQQ